jgi:arylsulfatase A-like enzyme
MGEKMTDKTRQLILFAMKFTKRSKLLAKILGTLYHKYMKHKQYSSEKEISEEFYSRVKKIDFSKFVDISQKPDLNVIIITVDCLRYRNMSFAGNERETTPFVDSMKNIFKAVSTAPWTYPSVSSILTGMYPHNHGAILEGEIKNFDKLQNFKSIRKSVLTLPEILYGLGYSIYFESAIPVATYPFRGRSPFKITYKEHAENVLENLEQWIIKQKNSFFAYVQLGDLHTPLEPPKKFVHYFGKVNYDYHLKNWDFFTPDKWNTEKFHKYREDKLRLYDGTLRYVDTAIERFYSFLENKGLLDSTILIITSDHGEEFWEHKDMDAKYFYNPRGYYGVAHGHNVFNELIEVPIIFDGIITKKGKYTDNYVSSVDIMPTILDLLEINHNLTFDGMNIFNAVKMKKRPILSEAVAYGYEKKALIIDRYKLLYAPDDRVKWLFDLKKDPEEQHPIKDEEITDIFIEKLQKILKKDETRKISDIVRSIQNLNKPL